MAPKKSAKSKKESQWTAEKAEEAMIEGILEGSPEGIGVAVIRLDCECRKMAAVESCILRISACFRAEPDRWRSRRSHVG